VATTGSETGIRQTGPGFLRQEPVVLVSLLMIVVSLLTGIAIFDVVRDRKTQAFDEQVRCWRALRFRSGPSSTSSPCRSPSPCRLGRAGCCWGCTTPRMFWRDGLLACHGLSCVGWQPALFSGEDRWGVPRTLRGRSAADRGAEPQARRCTITSAVLSRYFGEPLCPPARCPTLLRFHPELHSSASSFWTISCAPCYSVSVRNKLPSRFSGS
jgi:hypothetical protein